MSIVAVTGATGFIGSVLCNTLRANGHDVIPIGRELLDAPHRPGGEHLLELAMARASAVIHLAARAHVMAEEHADPLTEYRRVNLSGTLSVAEAASHVGVRRFVFISSIGVFGITSRTHIREQSPIAPEEPYAVSKWEAEQALRRLERDSGMEVVVVRPTLVYGPNAKGNFLRLMRLAAAGIPLPFGSIANLRSFIGVTNLCDLLQACVTHPDAAGQTFVAADGEDISTSRLLTLISKAMGRPDRQFRLPLPVLRTALTVVGRKAEFLRLTSDLLVNAQHARGTLQWQPQTSLQAGIEQMVHAFMGKSS